MKVSQIFVLERDFDEGIKRMLAGKPKFDNILHSGKAILQNLSFKQLGSLKKLNEKIYHLKVNFDYKNYFYQLVFTPDYIKFAGNSVTEDLLQIVQHYKLNSNYTPKSAMDGIQDLTNKIKESFPVSVMLTTIIDDISSERMLKVNLPILKADSLFKKIENFFDDWKTANLKKIIKKKTKLNSLHGNTQSMFQNVSVYIEYNDLIAEDIKYLCHIPKKHWLETSQTYGT